jgi:predicted adenine nucleotide alpha hydrolase (AANH) superfamily ATPase
LETDPQLDIYLWYYNPNIQPLSEYYRRRDSLAYLVMEAETLTPHGQKPLKVDFSAPYDTELFLAQAAKTPKEPERCRYCYRLRLEKAAETAKSKGYNYFSTTLLFSKQQKHDLLAEEAYLAAKKYSLNFYYQDFRPGWKEGQSKAKTMGLYRQNYCGCIYGTLDQN